LAIESGVSILALALVSLGQVQACAAVEAGLGGALIDVNLAAASREAGGTEALDVVSHWDAEASVLAGAFSACSQSALLATSGTGVLSLHVGRTLETAHLSSLRLVEVAWTGCAWSQTSV